MKLLLDTHALIWALFDDSRLNETAREFICNMDNQIFFSAASIWEVQIKHDKNPELVPFDGHDIMRFCDDAGYSALNIKSLHTAEVGNLKIKEDFKVNKDPFDRLLLSQAKCEGMRLLTHDKVMQYYDENSILYF